MRIDDHLLVSRSFYRLHTNALLYFRLWMAFIVFVVLYCLSKFSSWIVLFRVFSWNFFFLWQLFLYWMIRSKWYGTLKTGNVTERRDQFKQGCIKFYAQMLCNSLLVPFFWKHLFNMQSFLNFDCLFNVLHSLMTWYVRR